MAVSGEGSWCRQGLRVSYVLFVFYPSLSHTHSLSLSLSFSLSFSTYALFHSSNTIAFFASRFISRISMSSYLSPFPPVAIQVTAVQIISNSQFAAMDGPIFRMQQESGCSIEGTGKERRGSMASAFRKWRLG